MEVLLHRKHVRENTGTSPLSAGDPRESSFWDTLQGPQSPRVLWALRAKPTLLPHWATVLREGGLEALKSEKQEVGAAGWMCQTWRVELGGAAEMAGWEYPQM